MSRISVLTFHSVALDARVRRVCGTLAAAGHHVTLISPDQSPSVGGLSAHSPIASFMKTRKDSIVAAGLMAPASILPALALPLHALHPAARDAREALALVKPDIIHANDWMTLPSALHEKARTGARVLYDSHEMATEEHDANLMWRLVAKRHVTRLERSLIADADRVVTVGNGLADALMHLYPTLPIRPAIVRNMPKFQRRTFRAVGAERILTYVGLVRPERRIDLMIASLARLDRRYRLHIMGFGPDAYRQQLIRLASTLGVSDRLSWLPAVEPDSVADAASAADIGLFLTDSRTVQQRAAFPNKLFEYIAAGLMVVASETADIKALLDETGSGMTVPDLSAEALAGTLGSLTDGQIDAARQASLVAAAQLNWETEAGRLLSIYEDLG